MCNDFFLNYGFHICILNIYAKVYITYHYVDYYVNKMHETSSIHFACG